MLIIVTSFDNKFRQQINWSYSGLIYNRHMSKKVKIAHNYDELEDQIILTLQDRQLLGTNGL